MIRNDDMAAELLTTSASAYAALAANLLLEREPALAARFGESSLAHWRDHYRQRILELAAAVREEEPALFSSRISWARGAFQARELSEEVLKFSLQCLREILQKELPENHRHTVSGTIDLALKEFEFPLGPVEELDAAARNSRHAMHYLLAVLEGDSQRAIEMVVELVKRGMPVEEAYQEVLLAAQSEIGRMWHRAEVSVAEEHYVTSTTQRAMSVLCHSAKKKSPTGLSVVAAAVSENTHDIGVRAVADFFELAGWRSVCLGGDVPAEEIAQAVETFGASLALVSAALTTQLSFVRETVEQIRARARCKILVGGMAFQDAPDVWKKLGADGFAANPAEAVLLGEQLVHSA